MLIKNYGLFWEREHVAWGGKGVGNNGTLLGLPTRQLRADPVNFRNQRGVYVLYDDNFRVIYVGQAGAGNQRLFIRLRQHKRDHLAQRWNRFSWFGILPIVKGEIDEDAIPAQPQEHDVLNHIEAILIAACEPPLNLQRGRFGQDVAQYVQLIANENDEDFE